jgi:lipoprotein NlpI
MRTWLVFLGVMGVLTMGPSSGEAETVEELLRAGRAALAEGKTEEALRLADKVVEQAPNDPQGYLLRGLAHEGARRPAEAIAAYDKVLALEPKNAAALNRRGSEHFKLGHIKESIRDFDRFIELRPDEEAGHWKRGISHYYAGMFDAGARQFEGYEKVDTNDVENAVWHFLCVARKDGIDKARQRLLKIGNDKRVPMMKVYELFAGRAQPADVLAVATAGNPAGEELKSRLFYAHLYLGLYYEVAGDKKRAAEHMAEAAGKYRIGHYMGDVAHVHHERLRKDK